MPVPAVPCVVTARLQQRDEAQILEKLIRIGWGRNNPAFRQVFTTMCIPDGTQEQQRWFNDRQKIATSPEQAAAILENLHQLDVTHHAEAVRVPRWCSMLAVMLACRSKKADVSPG